eukprot:gnl/MRDRNA2_/MRDRNA2_101305_c0_seq1.p1 gnl/MRDRNA2_/MRDRNA2_101305_c0~~gnl/MRDRNA2_/MRDRNA2_101305_c0_seq1.p1  ORF type:complete len:485 (+),score=89.38 gnl/MRDRNA2_/MRDRNA2_101305_c0_seq1:74-1528(+)
MVVKNSARGNKSSKAPVAKEIEPTGLRRRALPACCSLIAIMGVSLACAAHYHQGNRSSSGDITARQLSRARDEPTDELDRVFNPHKDADGFIIDEQTSRYIATVALENKALANKVQSAIRANPLQLGARLELCEGLRGQSRGDKPRTERYGELVSCYKSFMDMFLWAQRLPEKDRRRQIVLQMHQQAARIAGERILIFAEGKRERLEQAVKYFEQGIPDATKCSPAKECTRIFAHWFLAHRQLRSRDADLEKVRMQAQLVPGKELDWPDVDSVHLQMPGIRHQKIWDPAQVPWLAEVEGRWSEVRGELDRYLEKMNNAAWTNQPDSEQLAEMEGSWNSVALASEGIWNEDTCQTSFPITCSLLRNRPELELKNFQWPGVVRQERDQKPPKLMVNIYQTLPGTSVLPHFGSHGRLIGSLGLKIPKGVQLRVGGEHKEWHEGKWLLFDDAFEHEVVHGGSEPRYVLAVAMLHPDVCPRCKQGSHLV